MMALLLLLFLVLSTVAIVLGVLGTINAFAKLKIAHSRPACDEAGSDECDFIETKESEIFEVQWQKFEADWDKLLADDKEPDPRLVNKFRQMLLRRAYGLLLPIRRIDALHKAADTLYNMRRMHKPMWARIGAAKKKSDALQAQVLERSKQLGGFPKHIFRCACDLEAKLKTKLRFKIGDLVMANVDGFKPGKIVALWQNDKPYVIELAGAEKKCVCAPKDSDQFVRTRTLRFKVGDLVKANLGEKYAATHPLGQSYANGRVVKLWEEGKPYAIVLDNDDDADTQENVKGPRMDNKQRRCVRAPHDNDQFVTARTLRFKEGDLVQANVGKFTNARILKCWTRNNPYFIELDGPPEGRRVWAPRDTESYVRARPTKDCTIEPFEDRPGDHIKH